MSMSTTGIVNKHDFESYLKGRGFMSILSDTSTLDWDKSDESDSYVPVILLQLGDNVDDFPLEILSNMVEAELRDATKDLEISNAKLVKNTVLSVLSNLGLDV